MKGAPSYSWMAVTLGSITVPTSTLTSGTLISMRTLSQVISGYLSLWRKRPGSSRVTFTISQTSLRVSLHVTSKKAQPSSSVTPSSPPET